MPTTKETHSRIDVNEARAGVERSETLARRGRRRARRGLELPIEVRDRLGRELVDELLAGARSEEEIVGPSGLLADLTRRLVERAISAS